MNIDRRQTLAGLFALAAASATAAGTDSAAPLQDALSTIGTAKTEKHPFGETTVFFEGKTEQLKSLVMGTLVLYASQEPHPPHQHPEEEIMIVTEGHGMILVDGKDSPVGPGAVMYSGGSKLHGVKNNSSKPMRFYYMKWLA